jgi:hypothetical protein
MMRIGSEGMHLQNARTRWMETRKMRSCLKGGGSQVGLTSRAVTTRNAIALRSELQLTKRSSIDK